MTAESPRLVLLRTEGRGGVAEIEVNGERLVVADELSAVGEPAAPGPLPGARLAVEANPRLCGPTAAGREKGLHHERGWRYRGCGEVVALAPLRVDLGPLELEVDLVLRDEPALGDRIELAFDRIVLTSTGRQTDRPT